MFSYTEIFNKIYEYQEEINKKRSLHEASERLMIAKQQHEMQRRQIEETKIYQNSIKKPSMPYKPFNSHK